MTVSAPMRCSCSFTAQESLTYDMTHVILSAEVDHVETRGSRSRAALPSTASDDTQLEEGMLFTSEPSITQFDSFSARVEDVVVVRPDGGEPLTSDFQSLFVVE